MKALLVALNAQYMHVNLALRQILCCLKPGQASLYEGHINLPFRRVLEDIGREKPGAVGFSTYIWNAPMAWRLCRALKRALPGVVLFAGGPQAESAPQAAFDACGALDYVLRGEGEQVVGPFLETLAQGRDPAGLPGVCCLRQGAWVETPPPPPMAPETWPQVWGQGRLAGLEGRILYVETSRGCPYRCAYCLSAGAGRVRALDAGQAVERLTAMAEGGAGLIKLVDRTFNFDRQRAAQIWRGLIQHSRRTGLLPRYHFEIGAHLLDQESLEVLAQAPPGLFQFEAGIQSANIQTLRAVGRDLPFEAVARPLERVRALGNIPLHTDLIAALPLEDLASFALSFDRTYAIGAEMLQLGFLKVLPGSPLAGRVREWGIAYEPDPPYEALGTPWLSFEDLCLLKDVEAAVDWYHNSGRYPLALRYLLGARSPFALFSHMARRLRAMGAFDVQRRERERAGYLLEMFGRQPLGELIAHDFLSRGLGAEIPPAAQQAEDAQLRFLLRQKFHPVRGQRARRYIWDVLAYEQGQPLVRRETVVFYA